MPGQNAERAGFVPGLACAILSTERSQHRYFHRSGPTVGPCQPRTITGLQCFFGYHQAPGVLKQNSITTDVSADDPVILIFHRPVFLLDAGVAAPTSEARPPMRGKESETTDTARVGIRNPIRAHLFSARRQLPLVGSRSL